MALSSSWYPLLCCILCPYCESIGRTKSEYNCIVVILSRSIAVQYGKAFLTSTASHPFKLFSSPSSQRRSHCHEAPTSVSISFHLISPYHLPITWVETCIAAFSLPLLTPPWADPTFTFPLTSIFLVLFTSISLEETRKVWVRRLEHDFVRRTGDPIEEQSFAVGSICESPRSTRCLHILTTLKLPTESQYLGRDKPPTVSAWLPHDRILDAAS